MFSPPNISFNEKSNFIPKIFYNHGIFLTTISALTNEDKLFITASSPLKWLLINKHDFVYNLIVKYAPKLKNDNYHFF